MKGHNAKSVGSEQIHKILLYIINNMKVNIKIIEEHTDEKKFAKRVADTMVQMNTTRVAYAVTLGPKGYLYSAMITKVKRF